MAHIVLRGGLVVTYDDADIGLVSRYVWHRHLVGPNLYAKGYPKGNRKAGLVYMHRLITGAEKGTDVDHKNGDGLDNRRENLRLCSRSQNNANRKISRSACGVKGVYWEERTKCWRAEIQSEGVRHRLGRFSDMEAAAEAYRKKSLEIHGSFSSHA